MKKEYQDWIDMNVDGDGAGLCMEYAELMVKTFPELKAVYGSYVLNGTPFQHCWCVDQESNIVDPTAHQFAPGGHYEQSRELIEVPERLRELAREAARIIVQENERDSVYEAWITLRIIVHFEQLLEGKRVPTKIPREVIPSCPRVSMALCYNPLGVGDCAFMSEAHRGHRCPFNEKPEETRG